MNQEKAREILIKECEKHYNYGGCYTKCRCRIDGKCKGTTKDTLIKLQGDTIKCFATYKIEGDNRILV